MVPKFTLVPSTLFDSAQARRYLKEVVPLADEEPLSFLNVPSADAVLIYAGAVRPMVYEILLSLFKIKDYNKVVFDWRDGVLSLVVAFGGELALCNAYEAEDFRTAQYFIFLALNRLQINPQLTCVYSMTELEPDSMISLCRYFKGAEVMR